MEVINTARIDKIPWAILGAIVVACLYPLMALTLVYASYDWLGLLVPIVYLTVGAILALMGTTVKKRKYHLIIIGIAMVAIAVASLASMGLSYIYFGRIV